MNRAELAARVAARTSMSKAGVDATVNAVFSTIADALASGEIVTIVGFGTGSERIRNGFGTFSTKSRPARQARNPRAGEPIAIAASTTPYFKAGKALRDALD